MKVRRAAGRDVEGLQHLIAAMNREQGDPADGLPASAVERDLIGQDSNIVFIAAADNDTLAGYVTAHRTYETAHAEHGLYVGDLFVAPEHRRQGVARALLAAMARHGHVTGARHLWLTAKPDNTAAHTFYRRLGGHGEPVIAFAVVDQDFRNLAAEASP